MEGMGCIRAEGARKPGHIVILNDQGGDVMDVQEDVTATLRAQDHGHPPVVCFEPGIMSRDCSAGNRAYVDVCSTLRAQMGDNQPAVCYPINLMVASRGGKDDMRTCFGIGKPGDPQFTLSAAHEHGVCYEQDQLPESMGHPKQAHCNSGRHIRSTVRR